MDHTHHKRAEYLGIWMHSSPVMCVTSRNPRQGPHTPPTLGRYHGYPCLNFNIQNTNLLLLSVLIQQSHMSSHDDNASSKAHHFQLFSSEAAADR